MKDLLGLIVFTTIVLILICLPPFGWVVAALMLYSVGAL